MAFPRKIFSLRRGDELCGVICYCYPASTCFGRGKVFQPEDMEELNQKLSVIRRIVVHPKYRTIGLGHKLVQETLDKAGLGDLVHLINHVSELLQRKVYLFYDTKKMMYS